MYSTTDTLADSETAARQAMAAAWSVCGYTADATGRALATAASDFRASTTALHNGGEDAARLSVTRAWVASSGLVAAMAATRQDRKVRALADAYVAMVAYRRALESVQ